MYTVYSIHNCYNYVASSHRGLTGLMAKIVSDYCRFEVWQSDKVRFRDVNYRSVYSLDDKNLGLKIYKLKKVYFSIRVTLMYGHGYRLHLIILAIFFIIVYKNDFLN